MNNKDRSLSLYQKLKGFFQTPGMKPLFIFLKIINRILSVLFILIIKFYQISLSRIFPSSCRFYPSCSHYGINAFHIHGAFKGLYLTVRRILKCHPWHEGGFDPVPDQFLKKNIF
jgi:uncharacterized protein